jgi:hypothetical protein
MIALQMFSIATYYQFGNLGSMESYGIFRLHCKVESLGDSRPIASKRRIVAGASVLLDFASFGNPAPTDTTGRTALTV